MIFYIKSPCTLVTGLHEVGHGVVRFPNPLASKSKWVEEPDQGPASTRYSKFFVLLELDSDRVASSKTPRISTIIQKQPARRYFRIITANPDIQMQPSMEKMSSDLNVKKMEDVSKLYKLYFKNYMTHKFISSCPCSSATSGLSGRWPDPPPV